MISISQIDERVLKRSERFLFYALIIIFLFPLWSLQYFPTLDAPGHVYNGKILWEFWFGNPSFYQSAFVVNDQLNPNWISQCLLAVLSNFFSPFLCEKIIHSIYIVGFAFGFRMMVRSWKQTPIWLPLLGFAFIYNATLILGFLNFNLGIALLMASIAMFHRLLDKGDNWTCAIFFVIVTLLYFTHLVAIAVFFLYLVSWFVIDVINALLKHQKSLVFQKGTWLKLILTLFIPALLLLIHLLSDQEAGLYYYNKTEEITRMLIGFEGLNCFELAEYGYSRWVWILPAIGFLLSLIVFRTKIFQRKQEWPKLLTDLKQFFVLILFTSLIVVCAYLMPDGSSGGGGMLTIRLVFFAALFFGTSLFFLLRLRWLSVLMIAVLTVVSIEKSIYVRSKQSTKQSFCSEMDAMSKLNTGSGVLMFLDFNRNWLFGHYPKVLANNNNMIAMDNLGAHKTFSPIQWKPEFRKNDEVLCYVGDQWNCRPENLPAALKSLDLFILKNGDYAMRKSGPESALFWERYFADSCEIVWQSEQNLKLYKRIR